MANEETFPVTLDSRTVECQNERDCFLLKQAHGIVLDNSIVVNFSRKQVNDMIDTCNFYHLRTMAGILGPFVEKAIPDEPAP